METNLIFLSGDQKGKSTTLKPEGTAIGRETDNDIIIQDSDISRHHARILEKDGKWIFKDLGSSHGVTVNDIPIKDGQQELNPGDIILIGRHKLKFEPGIGDVTMVNPPSKEDVKETLAEVQEKEKEAPPADEPAGSEAEADKEEEKKTEETSDVKKEEAEEEPEEEKPEEPKEEEKPVADEKPVEGVKEPKPEKTSPSSGAPAKKGNSKLFYGCGGCGCLLTLLLIPAAGFMIAMANDSHMSELGPFGVILAPVACVIGIISLILLIIGMVVGKKKG